MAGTPCFRRPHGMVRSASLPPRPALFSKGSTTRLGLRVTVRYNPVDVDGLVEGLRSGTDPAQQKNLDQLAALAKQGQQGQSWQPMASPQTMLDVHAWYINKELSEVKSSVDVLNGSVIELGKQVEQRFAESAKQVEQRFAESAKQQEQRFAESAKQQEQRFAESAKQQEQRFAEVKDSIADLSKRSEERFSRGEQKLTLLAGLVILVTLISPVQSLVKDILPMLSKFV